ncbi:MAG: hypothetical protein KKB30_13125 [Proteobacteria bacterium]|nr:hypothetical protein [Pseudomonadota bacterium]MBU1716817.1 hypothetical protein [Pseudomonadota bacterium]
MVHRHLKSLLAAGTIRKLGTPPKVLYRAVDPSQANVLPKLNQECIDYINANYLFVKADGQILAGLEGFQQWAIKTDQHRHFQSLAEEYVKVHSRHDEMYRNNLGLIDATFKIEDTFSESSLDYLFYQDFYSIPKFGKTKMGQMVFLGKSGQNLAYIAKLADISSAYVKQIIETFNIDGIIFTPHSIPRKISFLNEYKRFLGLTTPCSTLTKVFADNIPIAQKSLAKLSDRIENAQNTIFVKDENRPFKRILVIDDAVGSGATLNTIAAKLKDICKTEFVCGYCLAGSLKGFEVISEV